MLKIIAAIDDENGIGVGNNLPWHLKDDLKRFKQLTLNSTVIMGRNTFESIGRPLEQRLNIVVSAQDSLSITGTSSAPVVHVKTVEQALKLASGDAWIIGGATIYAQLIDKADELWITKVKGNFNCDRFFPVIDESVWSKTKISGGDGYEYIKYTRCDQNSKVS